MEERKENEPEYVESAATYSSSAESEHRDLEKEVKVCALALAHS
jgi:hypothetical protein